MPTSAASSECAPARRLRLSAPAFPTLRSAVARIDFREEVKHTSAREFPITDVIWISEQPGLDICLLRVARIAGADRDRSANPVEGPDRPTTAMVAVVGFPGSNNGYDPAPFQKLFGQVTGNKRFSPGFYTGRRSGSVTYDCSTLPGSSGSLGPRCDVWPRHWTAFCGHRV